MEIVQVKRTHPKTIAQAQRAVKRRCSDHGHTARGIASVLVLSVTLLSACRRSVTAPLRVDYAYVSVSKGSLPVGDTATARAIAFSAQVLLTNPGRFTWSVADSSIVHLEATDSTGRVVVHAVKPGTTVIHAAVSGVTGAGGISVTP